MKRLIALCLVLTLLLCGCGVMDQEALRLKLMYQDFGLVHFSDMEYQRPNMTEHAMVLEESCRIAMEEQDPDVVLTAVYTYYDRYDWFQTNYALANIHYSRDLTDIYWEQEYNYCAERAADVDAGLDRLYHVLAQAPTRDALEAEFFGVGFFDAYEGESIWDATFTSLMEQEAVLINRYYELSAQTVDWEPMGDLLAELVRLRQRIANYVGYENYNQFAYDFYYYRDYTPEQVKAYLQEIKTELVPLYVALDQEVWNAGYEACGEKETFAYLESCVRNMGGTVEAAFEMLDRYDLYDISYSEKKFNASFEVYLNYYLSPYVFMNPMGAQLDKLTLVHEFGHFANDYACVGTYAGIDVAEVYSQALEYLSLEYGTGGDALTAYKMAESLCVFVEQAAYADFEHRLYEMNPTEVNAQNILELFRQVGMEYGFGTWEFDPRVFVTITHFYTNPQYVISYVVSNDAAMQIYQKELEEEGKGLRLYQQSLGSMEGWFLLFLEEQGLKSPFSPGRVGEIRDTLEEFLK